MKLRKVEIRDSGMLAVKTKEYTTDMRNVYYTRRTQMDVPKETIKPVRFDGGFQEAVISPRHREEKFDETDPEDEEYVPHKPEVKRRDHDVIMEYQPLMDTSLSKETNHIPLNIYRPQNGQTTQSSVSRKKKDIDDYDYKTDKVLSYYLQQERRPGTAKFDFTAQSKLRVNQGNKSASTGRGRVPRAKSHSNEEQGPSAEVQPNLGGGFLKIHRPLVLHQRSVEDEQDSPDAAVTASIQEEILEVADPKVKKHSTSSNTKPPIDPANLCLLCNCSNSDNWKMVDAMLTQSSAQDLTLPALKKTMKHQ
jgi:hypothetical protein